MRLLRAAPLVLLLFGCSAAADVGGPVRYRCEDGTGFIIAFRKTGPATVTLGEESFTLEDRHAASGMWYAADGIEFRGKGDEATWTRRGAAETICKVVPAGD